jgi:predicted nucleotidyltransferase
MWMKVLVSFELQKVLELLRQKMKVLVSFELQKVLELLRQKMKAGL